MSTIFERVQSVQDAYKEMGENRETLLIPEPKSPYQVAANDFIDAQVLAAAINEGWIADYDNRKQEKWVIYWNLMSSAGGGSGFAMDGVLYVYAGSYVGPRLSFKSEKHALHAAKIAPDTFRGLIKKD
mgnify:CR=1 FL=1